MERYIPDLPTGEDDRHEYKSSRITFPNLREEIGKAASGFWNSGGGVLVVGVDDNGHPDGGISIKVGKQSLKDWIDQVLMRIEPRGKYSIELDTISPGKESKAIVFVRFEQSHLAPHMAADGRYYIRAGAHTIPARSFIVEALWARRRLREPHLLHMLRPKPRLSDYLQLYVTNISPEPALDVSLEIEPIPRFWNDAGDQLFPLRFPVVDQGSPIAIDLVPWLMSEKELGSGERIRLQYRDLAGRSYSYDEVLFVRSFSPFRLGGESLEKIAKGITKIEQSVKQISTDLKRRN